MRLRGAQGVPRHRMDQVPSAKVKRIVYIRGWRNITICVHCLYTHISSYIIYIYNIYIYILYIYILYTMLNNVSYYHTGGWPSPLYIFFKWPIGGLPIWDWWLQPLTISPICSLWIHWRFKSTWHCRLKSIKFDDHHLCKIRGFFVRWLIWIQIYWGDSGFLPDSRSCHIYIPGFLLKNYNSVWTLWILWFW